MSACCESARTEQPPLLEPRGEGFENKIAELLARAGMDARIHVFRSAWIHSQHAAGAIPLNRFKCDLVIGVPVGFELASTTKPTTLDVRPGLCEAKGSTA